MVFEEYTHALTGGTFTYAETEIHYEYWTSRKFMNNIIPSSIQEKF